MSTKISIVDTPHITRYGERSRNRLECQIEDQLFAVGYKRLEGNAANPAILPYLEQHPGLFIRGFHYGTSIAGKPRIVDFALSTVYGVVLLEAKCQDTRGSAWEKIPFSVLDIRATGMLWALIYDGWHIPETLVNHQRLAVAGDKKSLGIWPFDLFSSFVKGLL